MGLVDDILSHHGIRGPWRPLEATGIANQIFATDQVVLRISLPTPEAIADAQTESIAAPAAHAMGIATPRMLAFDDSRRLCDTPYSLWERVRGVTVGQHFRDPRAVPDLWRAVGRELARLHTGIKIIDDPRGWLDQPDPGDPMGDLKRLVDRGGGRGGPIGRGRPGEISFIDRSLASRIERWLMSLEPSLSTTPAPCFIHDDLHDKNLMSTIHGELLALIDWGDAGWGDPALDFSSMPLAAVPFALEAYRALAPSLVDPHFEQRMLWARAAGALGRLVDNPRRTGKLTELLSLVP